MTLFSSSSMANRSPPINQEISRTEIQAAIAKAAELRALHAALVQGTSPGNLKPQTCPSPSGSRHSAQDYPVFTPVSVIFWPWFATAIMNFAVFCQLCTVAIRAQLPLGLCWIWILHSRYCLSILLSIVLYIILPANCFDFLVSTITIQKVITLWYYVVLELQFFDFSRRCLFHRFLVILYSSVYRFPIKTRV